MENKNFKNIFDEIAQASNFEKKLNGWFKESNECIIVLELQKSNFGNLYYLNIKIYVQDTFGKHYVKGKELIKDTGDIFRRQPPEYNNIFDLDSPLELDVRKKQLQSLFHDFILPFSQKCLTRAGIIELAQSGRLFLLPAVKKELGL